MPSVSLVVPAAGSGTRLGAQMPKALVPVAGRALLARTLEALTAAVAFEQTVIAVAPEHRGLFEDVVAGVDAPGLGVVSLVDGGATRCRSVGLALEALDVPTDLVCVHDAARPLVCAQTISSVVAAAATHKAATAARRPVDSVREDVGNFVTQPLERDHVWLVETPQVFDRELLLAAHREATARGVNTNDDCTLVEKFGTPVRMVESSQSNPKVTTQDQLKIVELIFRSRQ